MFSGLMSSLDRSRLQLAAAPIRTSEPCTVVNRPDGSFPYRFLEAAMTRLLISRCVLLLTAPALITQSRTKSIEHAPAANPRYLRRILLLLTIILYLGCGLRGQNTI